MESRLVVNKYLEISNGELPKAMDWVRSSLKETPLSQTERNQVELALEEAIVNILSHAFDVQKGKVELTFHQTSNKIEFELKDRGKAFNPLEHEQKIQDVPLEKRKEGGLGILLMRAYLDDVHYRRQGEFNILTLIKKINPSSSLKK